MGQLAARRISRSFQTHRIKSSKSLLFQRLANLGHIHAEKKKSMSSFSRQLITWYILYCRHLLLIAVLLRIPIERRPRLLQTRRAAIDRYRMPAGPTAANPPHAAAAVDICDRQTDGRTQDSFVDPAVHYLKVSIKNKRSRLRYSRITRFGIECYVLFFQRL